MKTLLFVSSVLAFGSLAALGEPTAPAAAAARSTGQVSIRADAKTIRAEKKPRDKDGKKNDAKPEVVTKALEVEISAAKTVSGPLKLVTTWYARDLATRENVVESKADSEVALDASHSAKVTSGEVTFTSVPSYSKKGAGGKMEKIDATGHSYMGWIIRAYQGDTLVGEAASAPPLLKLP